MSLHLETQLNLQRQGRNAAMVDAARDAMSWKQDFKSIESVVEEPKMLNRLSFIVSSFPPVSDCPLANLWSHSRREDDPLV